MNRFICRRSHPNRNRGFTLTEVLVALGVAGLLLATGATLTLYGARAFVSLGNYAELDGRSRNTLDFLSRELRESSGVIAIQTNLPVRSLTLTNAEMRETSKLTWDSEARTLVFEKSDADPVVCLTGCDDWSFALYNRAPTVTSTNINFNPTDKLSNCKALSLSWTCSRTVLGQRINTENVQGAQISLRNKIQ